VDGGVLTVATSTVTPDRGWQVGRARGQTLMLFALLVPVLLGFLGLSLDGGYYFANTRAVSIAADTAARAAATNVRRAQGSAALSTLYTRASSDGVAIGNKNLASAYLTGITIGIEYNDSLSATPTSGGWYSTAPSVTTRAVRAVVGGTYNTLFLRVVGVPSLDIQRIGTGGQITPEVVIPKVLPFAVCQVTELLSPNGPWTVWRKSGGANLCAVPNWEGLVNLDNRSPITCPTYQAWVGPPPSGPVPSVGGNVTLDLNNCSSIGQWSQPLFGTTQLIPEISTVANLLGAQVTGCWLVVLGGSADTVTATPVGSRTECGLQQTY
jgi:Flp pilus assembly protein TadG